MSITSVFVFYESTTINNANIDNGKIVAIAIIAYSLGITWINIIAIADMYPDGSGILFLDQEQSSIGEQIEKYLNKKFLLLCYLDCWKLLQ